MQDDLKAAGVFGDMTRAQAFRLDLEAAGIPAFLADEHVAGGIFTLAPAVGGIKVLVPQSRLAEAQRLFDEALPGQDEPVDWSQVDVGEPEDEEA